MREESEMILCCRRPEVVRKREEKNLKEENSTRDVGNRGGGEG